MECKLRFILSIILSIKYYNYSSLNILLYVFCAYKILLPLVVHFYNNSHKCTNIPDLCQVIYF